MPDESMAAGLPDPAAIIWCLHVDSDAAKWVSVFPEHVLDR
jgi:hypothetical protein